MPSFIKLAAEIFRDFITDGVPASGAQKPDKADIRAWGKTIENALLAGQFYLEITEPQYGVVGDGSTDDTTALLAAIADARGKGLRFIHVGPQLNIYAPGLNASVLTEVGDVIFLGEGKITGNWQVRVFPLSAGRLTIPGGIMPLRHSRNAALAGLSDTIRIAIVGDSISTLLPASELTPSESLWDALVREISKQNPGRSLSFSNFGIGATKWNELNDIPDSPANDPAWYTNQNRKWLAYVQDYKPHIIVFEHGINDYINFQPQQLRGVITTVQDWDFVPDFWFITNLVPSTRSDASNYANVSTETGQEGRDHVAGYIRSYAQLNGYGLIDANRQCRLVRDGIDVAQAWLSQAITAQALTTPYTPAVALKCHDFAWEMAFASDPFAGGRKILIQINRTDAAWQEYIELSNSGGFINVRVYDVQGGSSHDYCNVLTTQAKLTASIDYKVELIGNRLNVYATAGNTTPFFSQDVQRYGGIFQPIVSMSDTSAFAFTGTFWQGHYNEYMPQLLDGELFGADPSGLNIGGNSINHPSSKAVKYIYGELFSRCNFDLGPIGDARIGLGPNQVARVADLGSGAFSSLSQIRNFPEVPNSGALQLTPHHHHQFIRQSATGVLTLPAGADLGGEDFEFLLKTRGGQATLTRSGSDTLDGQATRVIPDGYTVAVRRTSRPGVSPATFETVLGGSLAPIECFAVAVSDETTVITTGTAKVTFRMPFGFTVIEARASVSVVSSSGLPTFDVKAGGVSIFSTLLTIDATEKTSVTAATPAVLTTPAGVAIADDAEMTVDITVAGTNAVGAKLYLIGRRTV